jgi:vitamin B12 transporter
MSGQSDEQDFMTGTVLDTNDTFRAGELFGSLGLGWVSEDGIWFQNARVSGGTIERGSTNAFGDTVYNGDLYKASYQVGRHFDTPGVRDSTHTVTLGYDLVYETFQHLVPTVMDRQTRTAHSLVGEYRGTFYDQLYLTAALRHDFNANFADATTYSLSGAWQIPDTGTRLHASVGTGSTNPTMWEQFGYSPGSFTPNPNLTPETSFGWDVGVEQSLLDGIVVLDATYFNQTLENKIRDVFFPITTAINVPGTSPRQGVELSATINVFEGLTAGVTYTYLDARDPNGALEVRRPQHSGAVSLAYTLPEIPLTVHGEVLLRGETKDALGAQTYTLPAYAVVNGGLNYQVSEQVEVYGRVHNLFDAKYQEVYGYNTQGRTFYAGARAKF